MVIHTLLHQHPNHSDHPRQVLNIPLLALLVNQAKVITQIARQALCLLDLHLATLVVHPATTPAHQQLLTPMLQVSVPVDILHSRSLRLLPCHLDQTRRADRLLCAHQLNTPINQRQETTRGAHHLLEVILHLLHHHSVLAHRESRQFPRKLPLDIQPDQHRVACLQHFRPLKSQVRPHNRHLGTPAVVIRRRHLDIHHSHRRRRHFLDRLADRLRRQVIHLNHRHPHPFLDLIHLHHLAPQTNHLVRSLPNHPDRQHLILAAPFLHSLHLAHRDHRLHLQASHLGLQLHPVIHLLHQDTLLPQDTRPLLQAIRQPRLITRLSFLVPVLAGLQPHLYHPPRHSLRPLLPTHLPLEVDNQAMVGPLRLDSLINPVDRHLLDPNVPLGNRGLQVSVVRRLLKVHLVPRLLVSQIIHLGLPLCKPLVAAQITHTIVYQLPRLQVALDTPLGLHVITVLLVAVHLATLLLHQHVLSNTLAVLPLVTHRGLPRPHLLVHLRRLRLVLRKLAGQHLRQQQSLARLRPARRVLQDTPQCQVLPRAVRVVGILVSHHRPTQVDHR